MGTREQPNRKPTLKQRKALDKIVENGGIVSRAMIDVGYSEATAKNPQKLTQSAGFMELCEEYGLTDSLILKSLVEDIKKKPQNRKPELELAVKIKGMITERTEIDANINVSNLTDEQAERILKRRITGIPGSGKE